MGPPSVGGPTSTGTKVREPRFQARHCGSVVVVSLLSFIAALIPVLKGGQMNVTFLGSGVVFLVVGIASAKKARTASKEPSAA